MWTLFLKVNRCKEDFDKERKDYQNQLQTMRDEIQRCQKKIQVLESQDVTNKAQVINILIINCSILKYTLIRWKVL